MPTNPIIPAGLCQCGCGQPTTVSNRTKTSKGHVKGQPMQFLPGHNLRRTGTAPENRQRLKHPPTPFICQTCDQTFYRPAWMRPNYCSSACRGVAKRNLRSRLCEWCGTVFIGLSYQVKQGKGKYCSTTCYGMAKRKPKSPIEERFWSKVDKTGDCWLWTGSLDRKGYARFTAVKPKSTGAHRFAYELAHGPIPDGLYVCHHCDVPACVRPEHMFLGTQSDNMQDAVAKGRQSHGERVPAAKLTADKVRTIRTRFANGESAISIARDFDIVSGSIYNIVYRKRWRHVA